MFELSKAQLEKVIVHQIGNKSAAEGNLLADNPVNFEAQPDLSAILLDFFLKTFKDLPFYQFTHVAELSLNPVYTIIASLFNDQEQFIKQSKDLCNILYSFSDHPKIKSGELYIAYFSNCTVDGKNTAAVGIFKSEHKDIYLDIQHETNKCRIRYEEGINIRKPDKGCLIFNHSAATGFKVCIIDHLNKSQEAQYWTDDFLEIKPCADNYHFTKDVLSVAKDFISTQIPEGFDDSATAKIDYLNKSVSYFKENDNFNIHEFQKTVFDDPQLIESFQSFGSAYLQRHDINIADNFEISPQAVKKQARLFKSVIKLDRNFHIYVHGNKDLIEQGYDERTGRKFYKIYFEEES